MFFVKIIGIFRTTSLFTFVNQTQMYMKNLSQKLQNGTKQLLNKDQINAFCSAWQWRRNARKASKTRGFEFIYVLS